MGLRSAPALPAAAAEAAAAAAALPAAGAASALALGGGCGAGLGMLGGARCGALLAETPKRAARDATLLLGLPAPLTGLLMLLMGALIYLNCDHGARNCDRDLSSTRILRGVGGRGRPTANSYTCGSEAGGGEEVMGRTTAGRRLR